jgi:DUF1009 family protein
MSDSLGLVSGTGGLPTLMAREARRAGWRVVAFAFAEPAALADAVDRVVPVRIGEVGPIFDVLAGERIRHVVLAGSLRKDGLFQGMPLDDTARALVDRSPDWTDEGLLQTATAALTAMGIELLDQRAFLAPWLAPVGHVAGPPLAESAGADVARGLALARDFARHRVARTVVVRAGSVVAAEATEGTDECHPPWPPAGGPRRGASAHRPDHDHRFDVPAVGAVTRPARRGVPRRWRSRPGARSSTGGGRHRGRAKGHRLVGSLGRRD